MGTLYVVATPIGNLQDITLRAAHTLQNVDVIACEDTRRTGILLQELKKMNLIASDIRPRLLSYYEENEKLRIPEIIGLLLSDVRVALISDAGTPTISDPGFKLVRECIAQSIPVESIPGASAVLNALVISALPTDKFLFLGYLPRKPSHRVKLLEDTKTATQYVSSTIIFYESPHRLQETLESVLQTIGDIQLVICREMTKLHEEILRGTTSELIASFKKKPPKGEFVILFHSKSYA
jgi:16S rRNA (cytidine1402-2'-O)-methyltransferase